MDKNQELFEKVKRYLLKNKNKNTHIETESALAERFNVSRYRIRKALSTLSQMGILDRAPKRGSTIRPPDSQAVSEQIQFHLSIAGYDISEFLEARMLFECSIVPIAIQRMTPSHFARMRETIQQLEMNAKNPKKADQCDRDFHLLLLDVCGNRVMQSFSNVLVAYFKESQKYNQSLDEDYFREIAEEHSAILNAIGDNNSEDAVRLLKEHLIKMSQIYESGIIFQNQQSK